MPTFTAADVQALRKSTGAGMMDAKKALEANDGDATAAAKWLREKGIAKAAERSDRANTQGAVTAVVEGNVGVIVELRSETDFVAKSDEFKELASDLASAVASRGEDAVEELKGRIDDLRMSLKENIELGRVVRFEAPGANVVDSYVHVQNERGVNAVLVELEGGSTEVAHDVALHIASARPRYLNRDDVPADVVETERETLENLTRNEGKPEQAIEKIVTGRLNGFFKDVVLNEQGFVKDEKSTVADHVAPAKVVRFAQVEIGA